MKRTLHVPIAPGRTFGAWVCLLAVVMLWAPMGAVAWQANGMACCESGMCVAHGHSKTNQPIPQKQKATPGESPMNCEHQDDRGVVNCSITCGHESGASVTTAVIFLLPDPAVICRPSNTLTAPTISAPTAFVQWYDPLSPPPRTPYFSF
jgi:hypothetical protein